MPTLHRVFVVLVVLAALHRDLNGGPLFTPRPAVVSRASAVRRRRLRSLGDLTPDSHNANRGTPRARAALAESLKTYGGGRAILADRHGRIIAGKKTFAEATKLGVGIRAIETSGDEIVVVQRTDLDPETPTGRALAIADNRVAELDLDWDPEVLKGLSPPRTHRGPRV